MWRDASRRLCGCRVSLFAALGGAVAAATAVGLMTGALGAATSMPWRRALRVDGVRLRRDAAVAVTVGLAMLPVVGAPAAAFAAGVAAATFVGFRRARRNDLASLSVRQAWPEALRYVYAAMRSGATVRNAVLDLSTSGPAALRSAFAGFPTKERVLGFAGALDTVRDELADPVADRVVEILVLAEERGGSILPDLLERLADSIAEDLHVAEEVRTNSLEQRLNARIVTVVPWVVLFLLTVRDGPYRQFYGSAPGFVIIAVAGVLTLVGGVLVSRLGRRPDEPRVLVPGVG